MPTSSTSRIVPLIAALAFGLGLGWLITDQLSASATSRTTSPELERLSLGDTHRGEITSSSELNANDGSHFERVMLTLEADTLIEVELGGVLNGALALYDSDGGFLSASTEYASPARLRQHIDASGDYLLAISGGDRHSYGPYRITSRSLEVRNSGLLTQDDPVNGWLQDSTNRYEIELEEAGLYTIEMHSDELDSYLALTGDNGVSLEDDDGAGGYNSRLSGFFEAGHYQLEARTLQGQGRGHYTVELVAQTLPSGVELNNGGELSFDQPVSGWYSGSDLEYQLDIAEEAYITLDMRSSDIDAYLELSGPGVMLDNDDGGEGHDSRITALLAPGTYTVRAKSYGGSGSGLFNLQASAAQATQAEDGTIEIGDLVAGELFGGAQNFYSFQVEEAGHYTIDMMSSVVDAYLELEGDNLSLADDDGGEGYDARIQAHLTPGEYRLIARSFGGADTGLFQLRVSAL